MTTVLVTGVGAVTGYGVVRSLRAAIPGVQILGADIHIDAVGAHWCDAFVPAPLSLAEDYPDWLITTCALRGVDLVLPTLDADLDRFAHGTLAEDLPCAVALNSPDAIRVSRDKRELGLAMQGDPACIPWVDLTDAGSRNYEALAAALGVPFLLKPRHGYGSRGQVRVDTPADLTTVEDLAACVAQQIVGSDEEEYTIAVFGDGRGAAPARIAMRRRLADEGTTRRVEVVAPPPDLDAVIDRTAAAFSFRGPTNLQLRRVGQVWYLLEINSRVSSSTSLRARFGFNEAAMTVDFFLHGRVPDQPRPCHGVAARYLEDVVLDAGVDL